MLGVLHRNFFLFVFCVLMQGAFYSFLSGAVQAQPKSGTPFNDGPGAGSTSGVGGVLISPTNYRINVSAGQRSSLEFVTANPGRRRSSARLEIKSYVPQEWIYTAQEDEAHERDAAVWFSDRDVNIEYTPGLRKPTKFKYSVPRGTAPGSYWCMLKFSPRPEGAANRSKIIVQIPIVMTVGRGKPVIQVSSPILDSESSGLFGTSMNVQLPLENIGVYLAIVGANGIIRDLSTGRTVAELKVDDNNLMPGTKRYLNMSTPQLSDGRYKITVKTELGSRLLPAVSSEYLVVNGKAQTLSEAATLQLAPLTVDPPAFSVEAPSGSARQQALRLTNLSDRTLVVDIATQAVEQPASGSIGLSEADFPAGLVVSVAPQTVTLRPHSAASVRVTMRIERDAIGEKWFGLSLSERGNTQALAETVLGSAGVSGTLKPMLEVIKPQVQFAGKRPVAVSFSVKNTGNQALQLQPRAVVLAGGVKMVARLEVAIQSSGGILPGVELPNLVQLPPDLAPGDYIVDIIYPYTQDDESRLRVPLLVEGEKTSDMVPAPVPLKRPTAKKPTEKTPAVKKPAQKPITEKVPTKN